MNQPIIVHWEVKKKFDQALEQGWTDDEYVYMLHQHVGTNYPKEQVRLVKKDAK